MAFGICGAGPVSTCKVHEFVLVRVIACLLSFYLFRLAARNGSSHCVEPKKKQATLLVYQLVVCFVRFVCSISHFQPPEIFNSGGDRVIGLNICSTRCFVQHFNEKPKLRIVSLFFDDASMKTRGFDI